VRSHGATSRTTGRVWRCRQRLSRSEVCPLVDTMRSLVVDVAAGDQRQRLHALPAQVAWSLRASVCLLARSVRPAKGGCTDRDAVWEADSCRGPDEPRGVDSASTDRLMPSSVIVATTTSSSDITSPPSAAAEPSRPRVRDKVPEESIPLFFEMPEFPCDAV